MSYKNNNKRNYIGFQVPTAVAMKVASFWDVAQCSPCKNQRFGGSYYHHLQGRKLAQQEDIC
jgi:hypothetical protein